MQTRSLLLDNKPLSVYSCLGENWVYVSFFTRLFSFVFFSSPLLLLFFLFLIPYFLLLFKMEIAIRKYRKKVHKKLKIPFDK